MASELLTPAENDLSVQMMDRLLGPGWHDFSIGALDAGASGAILPELFVVVNTALIALVSAMMVWQVTVGSMETAREGVPLGRGMHSVWAPLRAPVSLFLLAPIAKGYSILQVMLLIATYYGIGIADTVWEKFIDYVPERDGVLMESARYDQQALSQAIAALRNEVNYLYIHEKADYPLQPRWVWDGNDFGGTWTYGVSVSGRDGRNQEAHWARMGYGTISFRCGGGSISSVLDGMGQSLGRLWSGVSGGESPASPSPVASAGSVCVAMKDAITDMVMDVREVGQDIMTQYDEGAAALSTDKLLAATRSYNNALTHARALADNDAEKAFDEEIQGFARTAKDLGWASSAFYWWTLTSLNEKAQVMRAPTLPEFTPGAERMLNRVTDKGHQDYQAVVDGYLTRINDLGVGAGYTGRAGASGGEGNRLERLLADEFLYPLPKKLTEGNPLVGLASVGHTMIEYGSISLGIGLAGAIAGEFKIPGAGIVSTLSSGIGTVLLIEGAVFAYVIPMMPAMLMVLAIISWMVLVIEMLVAAPLLAAAHAFADGQDIAPPQTRHGYSVAIGATMRPLLLTFGFIFAWLLMDVSGSFLGMALDVYLHSLVGTDVGIVAVVSMVGVIAASVLGMVYFVMRLITHLAQHVPMWLGGTQGTDLGTDTAAQQAMHQSEHSGLGSRALVGAGAGAAMAATKAAGQKGSGPAGAGDGGGKGGDTLDSVETTPAGAGPDDYEWTPSGPRRF